MNNLKKVNRGKDLEQLKAVLQELRKEEKILVAILYGSYARGTPHQRSDIDLAVFIRARDEKEEYVYRLVFVYWPPRY